MHIGSSSLLFLSLSSSYAARLQNVERSGLVSGRERNFEKRGDECAFYGATGYLGR